MPRLGLGDKRANDFNFVCGGVYTIEDVGGFVSDGRNTKVAQFKNVIKDTGLMKADVFGRYEIDYVEGVGEKGGNGLLNNAAISYKENVDAVKMYFY